MIGQAGGGLGGTLNVVTSDSVESGFSTCVQVEGASGLLIKSSLVTVRDQLFCLDLVRLECADTFCQLVTLIQ